jgi:ribosomal-protein-alanine N-acetyltransferase
MLTFNFDRFPYLETDRLNLRPIALTDSEAVFRLRSNPVTMQYVPRPLAVTIDDAIAHIQMIIDKISINEGINWALTLKGDDKMIGIAGFYRFHPENYRSELGYMLLPEYHNNGYISEAIHTLLGYAFDTLNFHSIEAIIDPRNIASEKVLVKNNFVKEAHIRENEYWNGEFLDTVIYSILKRDLKAN